MDLGEVSTVGGVKNEGAGASRKIKRHKTKIEKVSAWNVVFVLISMCYIKRTALREKGNR